MIKKIISLALDTYVEDMTGIDIRTQVPETYQDCLVIVCFSEFCRFARQDEMDAFFNRFSEYLIQKKKICFLNEDSDYNHFDFFAVKKNISKADVKHFNASQRSGLIKFVTSYEDVLSSFRADDSVEIGGSFKEACVAKCAINICDTTLITSFHPPFGFQSSELDEECRDICIRHGVVSDLMSISIWDRKCDSNGDMDEPQRKKPNH